MAWFDLFIAGILEVIWAISLKFSNGFSQILPSIIAIIGMIASFYFLSLATKVLPIGTAYTVWTGFGAIGTIILGILLFNEDVNPMRILFLIMIIIGITGVKLTYHS